MSFSTNPNQNNDDFSQLKRIITESNTEVELAKLDLFDRAIIQKLAGLMSYHERFLSKTAVQMHTEKPTLMEYRRLLAGKELMKEVKRCLVVLSKLNSFNKGSLKVLEGNVDRHLKQLEDSSNLVKKSLRRDEFKKELVSVSATGVKSTLSFDQLLNEAKDKILKQAAVIEKPIVDKLSSATPARIQAKGDIDVAVRAFCKEFRANLTKSGKEIFKLQSKQNKPTAKPSVSPASPLNGSNKPNGTISTQGSPLFAKPRAYTQQYGPGPFPPVIELRDKIIRLGLSPNDDAMKELLESYAKNVDALPSAANKPTEKQHTTDILNSIKDVVMNGKYNNLSPQVIHKMMVIELMGRGILTPKVPVPPISSNKAGLFSSSNIVSPPTLGSVLGSAPVKPSRK